MKIDKKQVEHIAKLAKLRISDEDAVRLTKEMDKMINFADQLAELDTEGIEPTMHAIFVSNVFREDKIEPSFTRKQVLSCAPEKDEQFIIVPNIID